MVCESIVWHTPRKLVGSARAPFASSDQMSVCPIQVGLSAACHEPLMDTGPGDAVRRWVGLVVVLVLLVV